MTNNSSSHLSRIGKSLAVLVALAASTFQANAATLYGTLGTGSTISTLVQIDPLTGVMTAIGSVGYSVNGLTYDSTTGTLYGSARNGGGLLTINTSTGAGSLVNGGFGLNNVLLASDSDGDLYGWFDPSNDDLTAINKVTGAASIVGESGVGTARHGLAFEANDVLYMHNIGGSFYTVNPLTGATTYMGSTGRNAHHGDFNPETNYYYGVGDGGELVILDLVGGGNYIGSVTTSMGGLHTLAFVSDVPEAGTTVLLLGISVLGLAATRRKSKS